MPICRDSTRLARSSVYADARTRLWQRIERHPTPVGAKRRLTYSVLPLPRRPMGAGMGDGSAMRGDGLALTHSHACLTLACQPAWLPREHTLVRNIAPNLLRSITEILDRHHNCDEVDTSLPVTKNKKNYFEMRYLAQKDRAHRNCRTLMQQHAIRGVVLHTCRAQGRLRVR